MEGEGGWEEGSEGGREWRDKKEEREGVREGGEGVEGVEGVEGGEGGRAEVTFSVCSSFPMSPWYTRRQQSGEKAVMRYVSVRSHPTCTG